MTATTTPSPTLQQTAISENKTISLNSVIIPSRAIETPELANLVQATFPTQPAEEGFELKDEQTFKNYIVRIYQKKSSEAGYFEIFRNNEQIYRQEGYYFFVGDSYKTEGDDPTSMGVDITGNSAPDLVISEWTGGSHCCKNYNIFEIGETFKKIDTIETSEGGSFVNLDEDNTNLEFETTDAFTFINLRGYCLACTPRPKVILQLQDGKYRVADKLMSTAPPSKEELQVKLEQIQNDVAWQSEFPPVELWWTMTDLIYTGNAKLARQFYDDVWPVTEDGKKKFLDEFNAEFAKSPYWDEIQRINE